MSLGKASSHPRPVPAAPSSIGLVGPAWTRGEMERPAGTQDMGTYKTLVRGPAGPVQPVGPVGPVGPDGGMEGQFLLGS